MQWPIIAQGEHVRVRKGSGCWVFKEFKKPESRIVVESLIRLRSYLPPGYTIPEMIVERRGYFQKFATGRAPSRKESMRHAFQINQSAARSGIYFADLNTRNLIVGKATVFVVDTLAVDMRR